MIDQATVQKIKDTADIVEVVSDYVHLVRRGSNYMGLCPFHNERTPSFSVNKSRNFCYCFSCRKGGSPVNFIMEKEGVSYHDALLHLAKKYGIKVEEKELTDEEREKQSRREGMYVANEWAMKYFENNLLEKPDGRDIGLQYLYGRGVTEEAIKQFHLGYAIDRGSDFVEASLKKGFNRDVMKTLGLIGTSQQGHDYDKFRGRVIFPILNSSGKVVAFGGRDLKGGLAKYINSPESELYKKSNELYGMFQARSAINREDRCYLVEGYLDVIGMWQSGMKNVVASSGTALTDGQIALIHRFTKNVTLIYDGDAGIKASLRGIDMLLSQNLNVKVLLLPDGDDPDSFARKHTPEEFREYVLQHETDIIRFKAQVLMNDVNNDPQKRIEAIRSVVSSLACIPEKVKRDVYIQECSRILQVSEESISSAVAEAFVSIAENLRKQRRLRELNNNPEYRINENLAPTEPTGNPYPENPGNTPGSANVGDNPTMSISNPAANPLRPMEWEVLVYCIKFGFLDFCEAVDENNNKSMIPVIEYVYEELTEDNFWFSVDEYSEIFNLLMNLYQEYIPKLNEYKAAIEVEKKKTRDEGISEIAAKQLSVNEIKRAEDKLEEEIAQWEENKIYEFSRSYPSRILASHENDVVRRLTMEAISEKHQLSKIYYREKPMERDDSHLFSLLPSAITVWKNGLLDKQFNELINEFRNIAGKGMQEEEKNMQAKILELSRIRSEFAKNIGDRILCPVSGKSRIPRINPK